MELQEAEEIYKHLDKLFTERRPPSQLELDQLLYATRLLLNGHLKVANAETLGAAQYHTIKHIKAASVALKDNLIGGLDERKER